MHKLEHTGSYSSTPIFNNFCTINSDHDWCTDIFVETCHISEFELNHILNNINNNWKYQINGADSIYYAWGMPTEIASSTVGDCKDFTFYVYKELVNKGIPKSCLMPIVASTDIFNNRINHMALAIKAGNGWHIADVGINRAISIRHINWHNYHIPVEGIDGLWAQVKF